MSRSASLISILTVMTFTFVGNQIEAVRNILNPDKLTHLHAGGSLVLTAPGEDVPNMQTDEEDNADKQAKS
jgi:hypothetical protein